MSVLEINNPQELDYLASVLGDAMRIIIKDQPLNKNKIDILATKTGIEAIKNCNIGDERLTDIWYVFTEFASEIQLRRRAIAAEAEGEWSAKQKVAEKQG